MTALSINRGRCDFGRRQIAGTVLLCAEKISAHKGETMKALYIFAHPDDESFGPAAAMSKQRRQGHEVYLLTLTKGGATRQRHKYGYSVAEMGEVRYREMQDVARVLDLSGMTVLDLPDSGLKEMDPREIERAVAREIERIQPDVIVTDAVHGVSGFHDHLVTHAVVKRTYVALRERAPYLKRLAFSTVTEEQAKGINPCFSGSKPQEIDCLFAVDEVDVENKLRALDCYVTYQDAIVEFGIRDRIIREISYEIFQEDHDPPVEDLFEGL
jgi:LmbE family N-acetylglucosaminyl deacetylase